MADVVAIATATNAKPTCATCPPQYPMSFLTVAPIACGHDLPPAWARPIWWKKKWPMVPMTKPARPITTTTGTDLTPTTTAKAAATRPALIPNRLRSHMMRDDATLHGATAPNPIDSSNSRANGMVTRLKNGWPTETSLPVNASTMRGKVVPNRTVNANRVIRKLFRRMNPSRDESESSRGDDATVPALSVNKASEPKTTTARNPRRAGPTADWLKAWIDAMTPERVMKVPKMVRAKVAMMRTKFHACNIDRRCCTTAEWMKAVAARKGSSAAFSTGSHAQYPPHPRTS